VIIIEVIPRSLCRLTLTLPSNTLCESVVDVCQNLIVFVFSNPNFPNLLSCYKRKRVDICRSSQNWIPKQRCSATYVCRRSKSFVHKIRHKELRFVINWALTCLNNCSFRKCRIIGAFANLGYSVDRSKAEVNIFFIFQLF